MVLRVDFSRELRHAVAPDARRHDGRRRHRRLLLQRVALKNSSTYDAYWSVAPMALAAYWAATGHATSARVALVIVLVMWWGARLTWNWARTWMGLHHEDWRYVDLRHKTGRAWPLVNFLGIHLFPTVQVFLGLLRRSMRRFPSTHH